MKKKILVSVLAISLLLSQGTVVLADNKDLVKDEEIETIKEVEIVPHVNMTLEQAYERVKNDSPQALTANLVHEQELAASKGYTENLSDINRMIRLDIGDSTQKPLVELRVNFAKAQAEKNYEAALNQIKRDVYEKYYTHKQVEAQLQAAKDNYDRAAKLKQEADLKFRVGKAARLEVLNADTALNEAKDAYEKAQNGFEASKMGYNLFMGYNVKQEFSLTNPLEPFALPKTGLEEAIQLAKVNRNEMADARQKAKLARAALQVIHDYPRSSSTYKKAKVGQDMAMFALKNAPSSIELDVRTKYATMKQNLDAVNIAKKNFENTKEIARLGQLQFNTGFITTTDLKAMNLAVYNAHQNYNKAVLDYNLSVTDYYQCTTVGLKQADI